MVAEGKANGALSAGSDSDEFADFAIHVEGLDDTEGEVGQLDDLRKTENSSGVGAPFTTLFTGEPTGGLIQGKTKGGEVFLDLAEGDVGDGDVVSNGLGPLVGGQGGSTGEAEVIDGFGDGGDKGEGLGGQHMGRGHKAHITFLGMKTKNKTMGGDGQIDRSKDCVNGYIRGLPGGDQGDGVLLSGELGFGEGGKLGGLWFVGGGRWGAALAWEGLVSAATWA